MFVLFRENEELAEERLRFTRQKTLSFWKEMTSFGGETEFRYSRKQHFGRKMP